MPQVSPSRSEVQSDPITETPVKPCRVVPDQMGKMSQYSEFSAGQSGQNEVSEGENSDSGNSLFITQVPVPEAVRSQRRRRLTLRSDASCSEDPVTDDGESDTDREKDERTHRLPTYSISFLTQKTGQRSTHLSAHQNRKLHYALMGGYFKCVRELWESYKRGEDLVASQPTIDMIGVNIAPISEEEEEEELEDKDIKVVEKKHFVVPSKAKHSKSWCSPEETVFLVRQKTRRPSVSGFESQRRQMTGVDKDSTWKPSLKVALSPDRKRRSISIISADGNASDDVAQDRETGDKCETSAENVEVQPELQNTERTLKQAKRKIFNQQENEKELDSSSSATVCEPSPTKSVKRRKKGSAAVLGAQSAVGLREHEPEGQNLLQDDDTLCSQTRVKKKKKDRGDHEGVEEGRDQSEEEVRGQHAEAYVSAGTTEVEEAPSLSSPINEPDLPELKHKKKKRKKKKSATEDIGQDVDGHADGRVEESSVLNPENGDKKKKKKKKRNRDHMDVEESNTNTLAEHLTDNGKILKKKRKKDLNETSDVPQTPTESWKGTGDCLENTFVSQKTLEFSHVQRKKHKKKKKSAFNDNHVGESTYTHVDFNNDGTNLTESTGVSVKKKSISETCMDVSYTPDEDKNADDAQKTTEEKQDAEMMTKKKKNKKKKEKLSTYQIEDIETPSDCSPSGRKKKTSSFLVADQEEKSSQGAEKTGVSEGRLTTKDAEINGSFGKSEKKKKKRSAPEENVEREEFEEPKETSQKVLSETGVRKKKKTKRNESELISTERLENAAQTDDVVVMRKKKKKDKKVIPPAATEALETEKPTSSTSASGSPKKKVKQGHRSKISHESSFCNDQELRETLVQDTLSTPGNKTLGDKKKKENAANNHVCEVKSLISSVETPKTKKKERKEPPADGRLSSSLSKTSPSQLETSSSKRISKNKHMKGKRRLHNPNEDFL